MVPGKGSNPILLLAEPKGIGPFHGDSFGEKKIPVSARLESNDPHYLFT
ncbi:MAG: hypothetical protein Q4E53_11800 [Eubacteriales bacterium]|nr:hypothetical protein [Eubacteriales bacterium]